MQATVITCDNCGKDCTHDGKARNFYGGFFPSLVPYFCGSCMDAMRGALAERTREGTAVWNVTRKQARK